MLDPDPAGWLEIRRQTGVRVFYSVRVTNRKGGNETLVEKRSGALAESAGTRHGQNVRVHSVGPGIESPIETGGRREKKKVQPRSRSALHCRTKRWTSWSYAFLRAPRPLSSPFDSFRLFGRRLVISPKRCDGSRPSGVVKKKKKESSASRSVVERGVRGKVGAPEIARTARNGPSTWRTRQRTSFKTGSRLEGAGLFNKESVLYRAQTEDHVGRLPQRRPATEGGVLPRKPRFPLSGDSTSARTRGRLELRTMSAIARV